MKLVFILAAGLTLAGCVGHYIAPAEQQAVARLKSITNPAKLCQALNDVNKKPNVYGGVATMPREEFDVYYAEHQYLTQQTAARGLECDPIKAVAKSAPAARAPVAELTPQQKQKRAAYACDGYASTTRFADPTVAYAMCGRGFKATPTKCKADTAEFSRQAQTLTGAERAEYVEIGNAFRAGCNLK